MESYTYEQIKERILKWSQNEIKRQYANYDFLEVEKNEKEILLIDLTFKFCLAQIVVNDPDFSPYQYVSFEAMTLDSKKSQRTGEPELVYFFYDSNEMIEKEVIDELNFAINFCYSYIPDELRGAYINKKGMVVIGGGDLRHLLHPDDVNKYNKDLMDSSFECIGVQSQYLLVQNNALSLRILPQIFIVE